MTAGREVTPKDAKNTERLNAYWVDGPGALLIRWGHPGDFERCVRAMAEHTPLPPEEARGHCNKLHMRALGVAPGQEGPSRHGHKGR